MNQKDEVKLIPNDRQCLLQKPRNNNKTQIAKDLNNIPIKYEKRLGIEGLKKNRLIEKLELRNSTPKKSEEEEEVQIKVGNSLLKDCDDADLAKLLPQKIAEHLMCEYN